MSSSDVSLSSSLSSSKTQSNSIYNEKRWCLSYIPLETTWKSNKKLSSEIDRYSLPNYEVDLPNYHDIEVAKLLRKTFRKDFKKTSISSQKDIDRLITKSNGKPVSLKHCHLISWQYENDSYRTGSKFIGSDIIMADCDNTIPFDQFKKMFGDYRWFSRTSFGNTDGKEKFHVFFLLDQYIESDKIRILTRKLKTLKFCDNDIFDDSPFNFGIMLAGHYREDIQVHWNDGQCISKLCESIELENMDSKKETNPPDLKKSIIFEWEDDLFMAKGNYKKRVEFAKKHNFLVSSSLSYSCLSSPKERTEGGFVIYENNPDWVMYLGNRSGVSKFTKWNQWIQNEHKLIDAYHDLSGQLELDQADIEVDKLMKDQDDSNHIYKVAAGVGKTETAIKYLIFKDKENGEKERTAVFVPSHKLAKEFASRVKKRHTDSKVKVITGRTNVNEKMCDLVEKDEKYRTVMEEAGKTGISVFKTFCMNKSATCPHFNDCSYIRQWKEAGEADVVIMTHDYLHTQFNDYLKEQLGVFDRVIIDESFWQSLLVDDISISDDSISKFYETCSTQMKSFLDCLDRSKPQRNISNNVPLLSSLKEEISNNSFDLSELLKEVDKYNRSIVKSLNPFSTFDDMNSGIKSYKKESIPLDRVIESLSQELIFDREGSNSVKISKSGDISLFTKKYLQEPWKDLPITYLDASAPSSKFMKALTGITFKFHEIQCKDKASYYYENVSYTRSTLFHHHNDEKENTEYKNSIKEEIKENILNLTGRSFGHPDDQYKVLVCSYKKYIEEYLDDLPEKIEKVYFGQGMRGVDHLKKCDVAYIVGRQVPKPEVFENYTRCVYSNQPHNIQYLDKDWFRKENRGMEFIDGKVEPVLVDYHPDYKVDEILQLTREEETIQIMARLRSVRLEGKKIIFSGGIVLPLKITGTITRKTMRHMGFVDLVRDVRDQKLKVLPLNPETIINMNSDHYKNYETVSEKVVRNDKSRLEKFLMTHSTEKKKRSNLAYLLNEHLGFGFYQYRLGSGSGTSYELLTMCRSKEEIIDSLSEILSIDKSEITLIEVIPVDNEFIIHKKTRSFSLLEQLLFRYIQEESDSKYPLEHWELESEHLTSYLDP